MLLWYSVRRLVAASFLRCWAAEPLFRLPVPVACQSCSTAICALLMLSGSPCRHGSRLTARDSQSMWMVKVQHIQSLCVPTGGTFTIDLTGHTGQGVQVQLFYHTTDALVTY